MRKQGQPEFFTSEQVRALIPMARAIDLMGSAFIHLSGKSVHVPRRVISDSPDGRLSVFYKPAFVSSYNRMSIKLLTQLHNQEPAGGPTIKGMVMLIGVDDGRILATADAGYLTALRTGAASGLATRYLALPDASTLAVFGCGAQGRTQMEAVMAVRPIRRVFLFDTDPGKAEDLAGEAKADHPAEFQVNPGLDALFEADVICTATPGAKPLFGLQHVKPGVHINAVGSYRSDMQEIDPGIMGNSLIYLDDEEACLEGSGDLIVPITGGVISKSDIRGELGELILGSIQGRTRPDEITLFKSVGNAIQDFFIINEAYEISSNCQ